MKIVIISRSSSILGGVESIINEICRFLPHNGWDVKLALVQGECFNLPHLYQEAHPDLPIIKVDGRKGTRQARLEALNKMLEQEKPDLVLNMRVFDVYEAVGKHKIKYPATKLVAGVRCFEAPLIYDCLLYKDVIDYYVTSGELIAQACIEWVGVDKNRVMNIPGGVRSPEEKQVKIQLNKPLKLAYIGRLEEAQKRISDLPKLLKLLKEKNIPFTLDIAGNGPEEEKLKSKLLPEYKSKVKFHGFLNHSELYTLLPKVDILVHFAHTEGVTIAPREAMIHGVVPVISAFSGIHLEKQFINQFNALIYPVGDMHKAAEHIETLYNNEDLFLSLSQKATESQTGKYTHKGALETWLNVFNQVSKTAPRQVAIPNLPTQDTSKLNTLIPSPWLQQRIRDLFNKKIIHNGPGGEWPTNSTYTPKNDRQEIDDFAVSKCLTPHDFS